MADRSFADQLSQSAADLRAMSTEVRREVRPALVKAAKPIVAEAKANASWSRRIPGAIRARVIKRGVDIVVSSKKAPHARPYEGAGEFGETFRHPVFGNREIWVRQRTRPFLSVAVGNHEGDVQDALSEILEDAARRHGYR